jgi:hypothetical protein
VLSKCIQVRNLNTLGAGIKGACSCRHAHDVVSSVRCLLSSPQRQHTEGCMVEERVWPNRPTEQWSIIMRMQPWSSLLLGHHMFRQNTQKLGLQQYFAIAAVVSSFLFVHCIRRTNQ